MNGTGCTGKITGADDESHDASVTPGAEKKMTGRVYETP
ncbi:hypothetical protein ECDEC8A_5777 [Escherichia coli DEC8A]|nr:hypothetical protein ECDEC8A_5777 [Escherichia coli DEC8A]